MLPNWNDMRVAEQHRQDLLAEAARERRAADAAPATPAAPPAPARPALLARLLARLGRAMVAWGDRLRQLDPAP